MHMKKWLAWKDMIIAVAYKTLYAQTPQNGIKRSNNSLGVADELFQCV